MLLIIEALLLISAVQDHRTAVEGQIITLDMAEDSVDDQFYCWFNWCAEAMEHRVQTEFLKKEMTNSNFAKAWKDAKNKNNTTLEDNLTKNHSVAIYVYTNSNYTLYKEFNDDSRTDKQKYKDGTYSWYSLHFWLTEAIQILKETQTECFNTYRGTNVTFDSQKHVTGREVRFGQFASSSLNRSVAEGPKFGNKSCFEIYTCSGANVTKYSRFPEQEEVLIPPYETFTVTEVKTRAEQKDPWCDTVFVLESYSTRSDLNCAVANSVKVYIFKILLILLFGLFLHYFSKILPMAGLWIL